LFIDMSISIAILPFNDRSELVMTTTSTDLMHCSQSCSIPRRKAFIPVQRRRKATRMHTFTTRPLQYRANGLINYERSRILQRVISRKETKTSSPLTDKQQGNKIHYPLLPNLRAKLASLVNPDKRPAPRRRPECFLSLDPAVNGPDWFVQLQDCAAL